MIRLTALGSPHVATAGRRAIALHGPQPKRLALLAYLALARPRGAHPRDTLLALLWPELDPEHARNALRQALHGLRHALGADLVESCGGHAVAVRADVLACDVWELEAAAARGDHERVLALDQGALLAGLFIADASLFERWLDEERARVRRLAIGAAWALAEGGAHGDPAPWVRRALALSPGDEGAVRRGMRLLAGAGDRAGALAVYERFAAGLRAELDAEPSPETAAVARELRTASAPERRVTPITAPG